MGIGRISWGNVIRFKQGSKNCFKFVGCKQPRYLRDFLRWLQETSIGKLTLTRKSQRPESFKRPTFNSSPSTRNSISLPFQFHGGNACFNYSQPDTIARTKRRTERIHRAQTLVIRGRQQQVLSRSASSNRTTLVIAMTVKKS